MSTSKRVLRFVPTTAFVLAFCWLGLCAGGVNAAQTEDPPSSGDALVDVAGAPPVPRSLSAEMSVPTADGEGTPDAPTAGCSGLVLSSDGSTSNDASAPSANFRFGRAVYLITPAEAAAAGLTAGKSPGAIGWRYATAPGVVATGSLTVYLQNTADTTNNKSSNWSSAISGMTVVHQSASTTLPNTTAPFSVPFSGGQPFTTTGGGLYVAFDWQWTGPTVSAALVACNGSLNNGIRSNTNSGGPPSSVSFDDFRPETVLSVAPNDASVDVVFSLGSVAVPFVGPQTFQAVITNQGYSPLNNLPVTFDLSGTASFTDTQTIPLLPACGGQVTVSFAPVILNAIGANSIDVHVPPDFVNANNFLAEPLDTTSNLLSYKRPGTTADNGVGFTGSKGAFVAKFTTASNAWISAVNLEFFAASGTNYKVAIYPAVGGVPGTAPLYLDGSNRNVGGPGPVTITLSSPVAVSAGTFYAGIQQTNNTNANLSYDNETPVRSGAFYLANAVPPATWIDFAPGNNSKLNVGVTLIQCRFSSDCNDNNVCTTDQCDAQGFCSHTSISCDDNNVCRTDTCNPATGCVHTNNTSACDDNNDCTVGDTCAGGSCQSGTGTLNCDDGNVCTNDNCNPNSGCVHPNHSGACDDGNPCTTGDFCSGGTCRPGTGALNCDDGDVCTQDACSPATGCGHTNNSAACEDGNPCTVGDTCAGGSCQSGPGTLNCDDNNPCTDDSCDPSMGCVGANNTNPCDDFNGCTLGDTCVDGSCQYVSQVHCVALDQCHLAGLCIPEGGFCTNPVAPNGTVCTDGNPCTIDACANGACVGTGPAVVMHTITGDVTCDNQFAIYTANNENPGMALTDTGFQGCHPSAVPVSISTADRYLYIAAWSDDGVAQGLLHDLSIDGVPAFSGDSRWTVTYTDNNQNGCFVPAVIPSTMVATIPAPPGGWVSPAVGCANPPVGGNCYGVWGNFSTIDLTARRTWYNSGNQATADAPFADGFNHREFLIFRFDMGPANGAPCDDGNACTTGEVCSGTTCVGAPLSCDDSNACTDDSCQPASGCVHANNSNPCSDGNACTAGDTCTGGACVGGTALNCVDSNPCTDDSCVAATGCAHVNNTSPCSDDNACTTGDVCGGGTCQPGAGTLNCNDNNPCTNDSCNASSGCVNLANTAPCNDGDPCTVGDTCGGGLCQSGTTITAPPETQNVSAAADKSSYAWTAATFATRYDVVRGSTAAFPVGPGGSDEVCFDNLAGTTLVDTNVPALGAGFWYLSRGENECGNGTLGTQGVHGVPGAPRGTATCP